MTEILCRWLNEDVKLSKAIDISSFDRDFSNGYLIGEILSKHGLQDDFNQFSQSKQAAAKINNFMRLEPTINLLDIPFNTNVAREIMQEKRSSITQLLYQMYIALTNKQKRNITGTAMETMRPAGPVKLEHYESQIYQKQLKAKTPRQTDLDLTTLRQKYEKYKIEQEAIAFDQKFKEEERQRQELQNKRQYLLERSKKFKLQQAELAARINAAVVQIPKTPPKFKKEAILERRRLFERSEGENALKDIVDFEKRFKSTTGNRDNIENDMNIVDLEEARPYDDLNETQAKLDPVDYMKPKSNDDYISKIRSRLQEDAHARKEREKRRRKILVDQLKANEVLEESKREESLISHMLRQSQFERRIAVELLHARHEKDVIRENCVVKEREIEDRRTKEFHEALERERELARLARMEYLDQVKKDKDLHDSIAAERAKQRYNKHYEMCRGIVNQIVDLTCKVGEYRNLTDNLIPPKIWRDWISIFRSGVPLYPEDEIKQEIKELEKTPTIVDIETVKLLDEADFVEYKNMIGEWEPSESNGITTIPQDNPITGFIVNRLHNLCYPVQPGAPAPLFPKFPLKAIVLGKPFAGKTAALKLVEQETSIKVVYAQQLIDEAIEAYKKNPVLVELTKEPTIAESEPPSESVSQPKTAPESVSKSNQIERSKTMDSKESKSSSKKKKSEKDDVKQKPVEVIPEPVVEVPKDDLMIRRLGEIALNSLNNGEPIKDEIVVHIISEKIRQLPKENGWVIDGFPLTYNQAKLLEKALTGYDDDKPVPIKPKKDSRLAPNPKPEPPLPKHRSAIDIIIHLDISNETVLKRSAGRYCGTISQTLYHHEFKPPPEGSFTGLNHNEVVDTVKDPANDMEQLQHRITAFDDNWGKVHKFYQMYSQIERIKAENVDEHTLAIEIHRALDDFVEERERKKREEEERKLAELNAKKEKEEQEANNARKKLEEQQALELAKKLEEEKAAQEAKERSQSPPKSKAGKKSGKSPAKSPAKSPKGEKESKSGSQSATKTTKKSASPKGSKSKKDSTPKSPAPPVEPEVPKVDQVKPPEPGSEEWMYVDEKLQLDIAKLLCDHWDVVENSYVESSKFVFRNVREDREQIIRYFHDIRKDFKEYLRRPDAKQEFVDNFIKKYNDLPEDILEDEEVKAELHQRADDLKEDLWSICDKKKEEAEKECENIKNDGWLPDKLGYLNNHYFSLIQAELDRFLDTGRLLKDYYRCMQAPIPDEITNEYPRLPLIDLRNTEEQPNAEGVETERQPSDQSLPEKPKSPKSPRTKSPKSPSPGKKGAAPPAAAAAAAKKGKKTPVENASSQNENSDENAKAKDRKPRIPLVPRRPSSQDGKDKKGAAKAKSKNPDELSPLPPEDIDEKHIFDVHKQAMAHANAFIMAELSLMNIDETNKEAPVEDKNKKEKGPKFGKVVISKSRSPSAKDGKGKDKAKAKAPKPEETTTQVLITEEEKSRKSIKDKIKQEYWAALQKEEAAFKARIDAIKAIATKTVQDLKTKADNIYKDMNDWLGSRWMKEMDSIKSLIEIIKYSIENKQKIKEELVLQQEDFFIDRDIVVLRSPTPPARPNPVEMITPEYFTIDGLNLILQQFKLVAPEGLVAVKTFTDIYTDLATLNYGAEILPELWSGLSQIQIEGLAKMLANGSEFVDWRHWLLFASSPWPFPTQTDLLSLLKKYRTHDPSNTGFISKEAFIKTPVWFRLEKPATPIDIAQPASYDRFSHLLEFWFELFSQSVPRGNHEENMLNYKNMLLYLSGIIDPYEGFVRALSVSQEALMPKLDVKIHMKVPAFNSMLEYEVYRQSCVSERYPRDQSVSIEALYRVFHHGERQRGDTHRFASTEDPEDFMSMHRITTIYNELSEDNKRSLPYSKLIAHPVLCEMISNCTKFRSPDFRVIFNMQSTNQDNENDAQDRRTPND